MPAGVKPGRPAPMGAGVRRAGRLPSLSALRAFEAAARHLSCKRAGDELHLTPGAISYQVRLLETELGVALFDRLPRSLRLTATGGRLLASLGPAFDLMARGADEARAKGRCRLRVGLLPSFATHWLLSRLPRFEEAHPDIEVLFEPSLAHADFASDDVDLAIRYGAGYWPGVLSRLFMTEQLAPVCAPSLLRKGPPIAGPHDVSAHVALLSYANQPFEWLAWSAANGIGWGTGRVRMLHDYNIVLEAALAGQGVAMGRRRMIGAQLHRGDLVEPLGPGVAIGGIGYWIVTPTGRPNPAADRFGEWLHSQADTDEPNSPRG